MGFLVASMLFLRNLSKRELIRSGSLAPMVKNPEGLAQQVQVIQIDGPVFFGTSEASETLRKLEVVPNAKLGCEADQALVPRPYLPKVGG